MAGGQAHTYLKKHERALTGVTVKVLLFIAVAIATATTARTVPRGAPGFNLEVARRMREALAGMGYTYPD